MPTIFTHAVVAAGFGRAFVRSAQPARFWWLTALCAILPDFDAVTFRLGIPYASMWGHRGITHSVVFALVVGLVLGYGLGPRTARARGWSKGATAAWFALATASHPLLDMLTDGGLGVALWAPFSGERYFWPWRPVRVSPVGGGFFSARGVATLLSELKWLWLPALMALSAASLRRRGKTVRHPEV
ncbi:metal-dependent hydrolase [Hymenobacter busanensis]|uniref:Metal-dependent hydrolase n=1 Tax=Hymenobacter busanensis TaxID=2607656 RepID=A0A7L4ZUJ0_9BACT|nr:metal-dependent hydrolase [Hymenobacter busanensis]KAA9339144.1 metal-dependent hydrolase [Hymenobacter busanensis]QHJ07094.1 metal-dependent hydrolase [Hymenobacter busanensis]